jgi:hypothetical protein
MVSKDLGQIHFKVLFPHLLGEWELYKNFWEDLIFYLPLIRYGPHGKRRIQQFFYFSVCIHCRGNFFTEPLPSNGRGIHMQTHILMGFMTYAVEMGSRCHDLHTKFQLGLGIRTHKT